jgi:hypothetical protein
LRQDKSGNEGDFFHGLTPDVKKQMNLRHWLASPFRNSVSDVVAWSTLDA